MEPPFPVPGYDSCDSIRRIVSVSIAPNGLAAPRSSVGHRRVIEVEPPLVAELHDRRSRERPRDGGDPVQVVGSGARRSAASASPMPPNHANPSSWITPTAAPGRRFCPTNEAAVASSSSATPSIGSGIVPSFGPTDLLPTDRTLSSSVAGSHNSRRHADRDPRNAPYEAASCRRSNRSGTRRSGVGAIQLVVNGRPTTAWTVCRLRGAKSNGSRGLGGAGTKNVGGRTLCGCKTTP
jgi:hypothetical protein